MYHIDFGLDIILQTDYIQLYKNGTHYLFLFYFKYLSSCTSFQNTLSLFKYLHTIPVNIAKKNELMKEIVVNCPLQW